MSDRDVFIAETGPRDGLQNLGVVLPTAAKCELIDLIAAAGLPEIEAGSFVPPSIVPQFADIEPVIAHALRQSERTVIRALVPNLKGAEAAVRSGVRHMTVVVSASEAHNLANVRRTVAEQIEVIRAIAALRRRLPDPGSTTLVGALSTVFGCSIEGDVSAGAVRRVALALADAGCDEIALADTVGYAHPAMITQRVRAVAADLGPGVRLRLHLHDTMGVGLANAYAGLEAGIRRFDAAVSGLGGCPFAPGARGNIVTEDFVYLCERLGLRTGIDLERLMATRHLLAAHIEARHLGGHVHAAGLPKVFRGARRAPDGRALL
jgi:hydroxymethylglutaryl-CoA lyase